MEKFGFNIRFKTNNLSEINKQMKANKTTSNFGLDVFEFLFLQPVSASVLLAQSMKVKKQTDIAIYHHGRSIRVLQKQNNPSPKLFQCEPQIWSVCGVNFSRRWSRICKQGRSPNCAISKHDRRRAMMTKAELLVCQVCASARCLGENRFAASHHGLLNSTLIRIRINNIIITYSQNSNQSRSGCFRVRSGEYPNCR